MYSEIVRSPQFYLDKDEHYLPEATTFIMTGKKLEYLMSFLNSTLVATIFKRFYAGGGLGEEGYRYKKLFLEKLPIPLQTFIQPINDDDIAHLYGLTDKEIEYMYTNEPQIRSI